MKKQYKKFVFGETLYKAITQIPESEQLRFYRIIIEYGIDGIEPELDGFESAVWIQMKDMIDNTMPSKRGAPEGNKNAKNKENNSEQIDLFESNKTIQNELNELNQINQFEKIENKCANININDNENGNVNLNENANENEKENENGENKNPPPSFSPFLNPSLSNPPDNPQKNYAMIFEEVKSRWKEVMGQKTKETLFQVSSVERDRFINTLAIYGLDEIFNAIGNYHIARSNPEKFDIGGRVYGSLIGFLEKGVRQFYEDKTAKSNFRRQKNDG